MQPSGCFLFAISVGNKCYNRDNICYRGGVLLLVFNALQNANVKFSEFRLPIYTYILENIIIILI